MAVLTGDGRMLSINPATLEEIGTVEIPDRNEIAARVSRARQTAQSWGKKPISARLALVENFRRLLSERADEVAQLIATEAGKPLIEAQIAEVFSVLETCSWLCKQVPGLLKPEKVRINRLMFPFKKAYNVFEPLGVVAVISPWNFPFSIPAATVLTALAAGNTVVLKPSPKTPLVAELLVELCRQAGFPSGAVEMVQGDRAEAKQLVESDVDRVVFTGSVGGGRAIMSLAAAGLKPVTLELGGKHPAIVLADADVERCADAIVWSAFSNNGQACASIERMYVERPVYKRLVDAVVERTRKLRMGCALEGNVDVGPMIDAEQLERVLGLLKRSVQAGARVACGGRRPAEISSELAASLPGYFLEPTVLVDVAADNPSAVEEIFGPLLPVIVVDSAEEAVSLANQSRLALGASIWTSDVTRGEKLARSVKAGMVWVNDSMYSHACPDAPWGGRGDSGFGRTHGKHSLLDFVHIKHIGSEAQGTRDWNFPYGANQLEMVCQAMRFQHGGSLWQKLGALAKLLPKAWQTKRGNH